MPNKPDLPCAKCGKLLWRSTTSRPEGEAMCRPCRSEGAANGLCIKGCNRPYHARGMCRCHYSQWFKTQPRSKCSVDGCDRVVQAKGFCTTHYSSWHRATNAEYRSKRYDRVHDLVCQRCGISFRTKNGPEQRYCGLVCAKNKGKSTALVVYRPPRRVFQLKEVKGKGLWTSGQCRVCSRWFMSDITDVTCSAECRYRNHRIRANRDKERRRARQHNAYVADVDRKRVFKLDAYRCHLCGKKCDRTKSVPHPKAPTVDHVIPLAAGGTHEPANCRTACFKCNAVKGDRGGGEQLALIG